MYSHWACDTFPVHDCIFMTTLRTLPLLQKEISITVFQAALSFSVVVQM